MPIGQNRRRPPSPFAAGETIALHTASGRSLRVELREPAGPVSGTAILLHSSMASRRVWNSPREQGVVAALNEAGLRTLALDFRGHGESAPAASAGGTWSYDDLIGEDLPALCRSARERWPRDRVTLIGHSLGGQVAIASVAIGLADADAIVALATNVWLPSEEPNPVLRAQKAARVRFCRLVTRARGYFPARALGLGSDDEAAPFMMGWTGYWMRDRWTSDDLATDYFDAMSRLAVPLLAVASRGDELLCTPASAARFVRRAPAERTTFEVVARADDGGPPPDHMGLVTTRVAASWWRRVATFCRAGA